MTGLYKLGCSKLYACYFDGGYLTSFRSSFTVADSTFVGQVGPSHGAIQSLKQRWDRVS